VNRQFYLTYIELSYGADKKQKKYRLSYPFLVNNYAAETPRSESELTLVGIADKKFDVSSTTSLHVRLQLARSRL